MFFKEYKKEYTVYIILISSIIILNISFEYLKDIINFVKEVSKTSLYNEEFLKILLKVTGIAIILEYAITICEDVGEKGLANKIDFAGKVILVSMSIPIFSSAAELLTSLIS